jgi:hypothetical protein
VRPEQYCDIHSTNIDNSEHLLLECLNSSNLFIDINDDKLFDIKSQLSSLTLQSGDANRNGNRCDGPKLATNKKGSKIPTSRRSKRKGTYEVAILSEKNFDKKTPPTRVLSVLEIFSNFETLNNEEIVVTYIVFLRNSEPNPDNHDLIIIASHELTNRAATPARPDRARRESRSTTRAARLRENSYL